jgi:hypothetical protein
MTHALGTPAFSQTLQSCVLTPSLRSCSSTTCPSSFPPSGATSSADEPREQAEGAAGAAAAARVSGRVRAGGGARLRVRVDAEGAGVDSVPEATTLSGRWSASRVRAWARLDGREALQWLCYGLLPSLCSQFLRLACMIRQRVYFIMLLMPQLFAYGQGAPYGCMSPEATRAFRSSFSADQLAFNIGDET